MKPSSEQKPSEIASRFTSHLPTPDVIEKMATIRRKVRELAFLIEEECPESREKNTALTQLSFVMMSANSAIVQQCPINLDELQGDK